MNTAQIGSMVGWLREGKVGRAMTGEVIDVAERYATVRVTAVESHRYDRREIGQKWMVLWEHLQTA